MNVDGGGVEQFAARVGGGGQQPALVVAEAVGQEQHAALLARTLAPGLRHLLQGARRRQHPRRREQLVRRAVLLLHINVRH